MLAQSVCTPIFSSGTAAQTFSCVQASNNATGRVSPAAVIAAGGVLVTSAFWQEGLQKVRSTLGIKESKKDKKLEEEKKSSSWYKWALAGGAAVVGAGLLYWWMSPPSMDDMRAVAEGTFDALPVDGGSSTSFVSPFTSDGGTGTVTSFVESVGGEGTGAVVRSSLSDFEPSSAVSSNPPCVSSDSMSSVPSALPSTDSSIPVSDGSSYAPNAAPPVNNSLSTDEDLSSYPLEGGTSVPPVEKPEGLEKGSFEWWKQWWKNNKHNLPPHRDYKPNYTYQR
jgi:hypothetical protein